MKKLFQIAIACVALLLLAASFTIIPGKASTGVSQTPETDAIQKAIKKSNLIEQKAGHDFDLSKFSDVFINDPRGGPLAPSTIEFIESVFTERKTTYGYLDYKLAYYTWWGGGAEKLDKIFAEMEKENRKMKADEIQSLFDNHNRMAAPRLKGEITEKQYYFSSIDINGDVAVAIFDAAPYTNKMTLVKVNGQWLIANNTFLSVLTSPHELIQYLSGDRGIDSHQRRC